MLKRDLKSCVQRAISGATSVEPAPVMSADAAAVHPAVERRSSAPSVAARSLVRRK
jgi:hypothetical protein